MGDTVLNLLHSLLPRFPGVLEITLCSSDGSVLATAASPYADVETTDDDSQSRLATCVASSASQARKVLGASIRSTMAFFDNLIVIHVNAAPLIVCFICEVTANTGAILDSVDSIQATLRPVADLVAPEGSS
mmetsp:Transcript_44895/g.140655  ORF Transcript_44895/g.140655 Transcript_44895/m.140655 type:complete len:132 (-) Transcript_44895:35-430(-)